MRESYSGHFVYNGIVINGDKIGYTLTPKEVILAQVQEMLNRDKEQKFRNALIELGWKPPDGNKAGFTYSRE